MSRSIRGRRGNFAERVEQALPLVAAEKGGNRFQDELRLSTDQELAVLKDCIVVAPISAIVVHFAPYEVTAGKVVTVQGHDVTCGRSVRNLDQALVSELHDCSPGLRVAADDSSGGEGAE